MRDHGATGNGSTNDTAAINRAITTCNSAGGGTVTFPSGTYMVSSLRLKSNIRLLIQSGATIRGRSNGFDAPEPNPWDDFQDFGHSHFHNAMMWGEGISNFAIEGPGRIDGAGLTASDSPGSGVGDKQIACKSCDKLLFRNLTQTQGGHFFYLLTDCSNVTINNLTLSDGRDGINLVGCQNCEAWDLRITDIGDDAIPLKNDFSVGRRLLTENVYIHDSTFESGTNAVQVGSETAGDFRNVWFKNITVLQAGKAGIGLQTNDGGTLENFYIDNVTMRRAANPIFINTSARLRTPEDVTVGHVKNIHISNVTATEVVQTNGREPANAATISGRPGFYHEDIFLTNVRITYRGGGTFDQGNINPPYSPSSNYNPRSIGTRPAYGFFARHVRNLQFHNVQVDFENTDRRPAWKVLDIVGLELDDINVERVASGERHASLVLNNVRNFSMHDSAQFPTVNLANVSSASYSPGSGPPPDPTYVWPEAESGALSAPMQNLTDANASGGRYVTVAAGNNSQSGPPSSGHSTLTFAIPVSGTYKLWGRVITPTTSDDSFWVRVDGGSWVEWNGIAVGSSWHWDEVRDSDNGGALATFNLTSGVHTLTIAYREDGARLDRVLITNDPAFVPSGTGPGGSPPDLVYLWPQAESGTPTSPMDVASDSEASGGQYVTVEAGNNSRDAAPSDGHLVLSLSAPVAGTYRLWGRVIAASAEDDSMWVRVDSGPWIKWNEIATGSSWHWDQVRNSDGGDAVVTFSLTSGAHILTFAYREDGARLDRVLITNDPAFTPTGAGP